MENTSREMVIEAWLNELVESGRLTSFHDLHVDQIDRAYAPRGAWGAGAIDGLRIATGVAARRGYPVSLAAAFSLHASPRITGIVPHDLATAARESDWSPPSLYAFVPGSEPWIADSGCRELADFEAGSPVPITAYLCEWFDRYEAEYRCSLWIAAAFAHTPDPPG